MRKILRLKLPLLALAAFFALVPAAAPAQSSGQDDPPGRVGRLNYTEGSVSFQVQGDADWVAADPNRPLTTGDNLWADKDSRGEVHIDSTAIRLSSETGLSFLNLDDRTVQLQLPQGTIEVHLRQLSAGDAFEIDTPNLAFTLTHPGEYVISTDPNGGSTSIIVREGDGQATGGGDSWDLIPGQNYTFNGTDQLAYSAQPSPDFDDFESWCQTRDQHENDSVSAKYVSRDVDGYYDLDQYGDWSEEPDYGAVWYPRGVAVDWVPYHVGHWVYIAPWGWTWVDEEPWGFAPFHYGRWALVGARWGWVPGPPVVRPVYAPALVGFVGGPGFGLSVAIGGGFTGVAWFPLGPRDVFIPAYHASPHYVDVINVTNTRVIHVTDIHTVYNTVIVNRDVTHVNYAYAGNARAVTAVSRDTFVNARPVAVASVHINDTQMRDVHVVSNTAIAPTRTSYVGANAKVVATRPAVPFSQRPVVANLTPRVPIQTPHTVQKGEGFRTFDSPTNNNRVPAAPANNGSASAPASNSGFRSFTPPNGANHNAAPANNGNTGSNGGASANQPAMRNNPNATPAQNNGNKPPQAQQNNNTDRYRYSPPVRAKDENYDVHPPLNQNKGESNPAKESKPTAKENKDNKNH
jgi:hypothetical protein